jgi:hypothetical protein
MNLFEEAIIPYDELEAMFHRLSKERNMFWLGSFIHPDFKNHDFQSLLSVTNKPYRDLILANTITIFDFRIYLLARQCRLFAKMAKYPEITTMIGFFLASLGRQLQEIEVRNQSDHFLHLVLIFAVESTSIFHRRMDIFISSECS